ASLCSRCGCATHPRHAQCRRRHAGSHQGGARHQAESPSRPQRLGRAGRGRGGCVMSEPRESNRGAVAEPSTRMGPELANAIFSASRTVRIHAMNNRATQAVLQRLAETIREFGHLEGRLTVAVVTDLLVVNDVRVVVDSQHMGPVLFVIDTMKERHVEEIDITPDGGPEQLGMFVQVFFADPAEGDVFGVLTRQLAEAGVQKIRLTEWIERAKALRDTRIDRKSIQEESNKAMSRAVMFMGEVMR